MNIPAERFQSQLATLDSRLKAIQSRLDLLVWVRGVVFIGIALLCWLVFEQAGAWSIAVGILGIGIFIGLVRNNNRLRRNKKLLISLQLINNQEIGRLENNFEGIPNGEQFSDNQHNYSADLDLFGQPSVFQMVNRAVSGLGIHKMADWLLKPAEFSTIVSRQKAAQELTPELEWRQKLQAEGLAFEDTGEKVESLRGWLNQASFLTGKIQFFLLPIVLSSFTTLLFIAWFVGWLPFWAPILPLFLHFLILRSIKSYGTETYATINGKVQLLDSYAAQFRLIEEKIFEDPFLRQVQQGITGTWEETNGLSSERKKRGSASGEIARLARIAEGIEARRNGLLYVMVNLLFFWDIWWLRAAERWKTDNKAQTDRWFDSLAQIEGLASLAAVSFANPDWIFPEIREGGVCFQGKKMGHPLIPVSKRVENDMDLIGNGKVWLITGSNMSGKSTWLRTVGLNTVLGLAGAPVCAKKMRLSIMQVFTGMRTEDNLAESTSSFYAELKRLKRCIEQVKENPNTLFLLDEILKGTNSRDRHNGAKALIRQLIGLGGAGMVSTHDLELAELENSLEGAVFNYSFNSKLDEGEKLRFDYLLEKGPCYSLNASILMRSMGIEV